MYRPTILPTFNKWRLPISFDSEKHIGLLYNYATRQAFQIAQYFAIAMPDNIGCYAWSSFVGPGLC